ncbi:hypothetical protein CW710_00225 [Candidatus Bathyarchaeota archaeon]|nr:hypothetical protein [Candidatus Bathyarchaeota archaeon]RJS75030.1 MAG: hypothetical protein CW710_00225 [Candidatus Bathyarchaeota archaeon]
MRLKTVVFVLLIISFFLVEVFSFSSASFSQPDWIRSGVYVEYGCNVTVYKGAPYAPSSGTFRWTIVNVTDDKIYVRYEMKIEDLLLEKTFVIDAETNRILSIDGESVGNITNYLWISYIPRVGDFIQLENLTAEVVDLRKFSSRLFTNRTCWVTNATFSIADVNAGDLKNATMEGFIERIYDSETGILVYSRFLIEFKEPDGKVSQSYFSRMIISSTNVTELGSRRPASIPMAVAAASIVAVLVLARRILRIRLA